MGMADQRICEKSIKFVQQFFEIYLEDRDFACVFSSCDEKITWFGTGSHEICQNSSEALGLLKAEKDSWDGHFKIIDSWYQAVPMDDEFCLVFGELSIVEDGLNTFLLEMGSRFSMLCHIQDEEMTLFHCHFSVPNVAQDKNEFMHKNMVKGYNVALEEKLEERTRMLKAKTIELENLMANIIGGVAICEYDRYYTLNYVSDGFLTLTGYTRDELANLWDNKHLFLVLPEDLPRLRADLDHQLKNTGDFAIEYRLKTKEGQIIWVLDKGAFIPSPDNQTHIQRILIDITEKKEQEEALMLSEKRYEIAMAFTDVTIFDFNLLTKEMIFHRTDIEEYGFPPLMMDAVESLLDSGIILPGSMDDFRAMYEAIYNGAPSAGALIHTRGINDSEVILQLNLITIFDNNNKPVHAVGVKKDMTRTFFLEKEKEYGYTLASNKLLAYEVNLTTDKVVSYNQEWTTIYAEIDASSFSALIATLCEAVILPEDRALFNHHLASETLLAAFEQGQRLVSFKFRTLEKNLETHWFEQTINIILDEATGHFNIRCYVADITKEKEQETQASEERKFYETMMSTATVVYEVNLTKNLFLSGHGNWHDLFGISSTTNYTEMMLALGEKAIYPDERDIFSELYRRENALAAYSHGQRELICEYRRPDHTGNFIWVRCTMHLFQDATSGEIKGFSFIEDIDAEKKRELALIYKSEHDLLTGFYHKTSSETFVDDYLATIDGETNKHAFLMIDIDHFKLINDNFGHVFGDAILSKVSGKIHNLFREMDILGRIGGDEFIVLMKNIQHPEIVLTKAQEICRNIAETYAKNSTIYTISASIGIAFYPEHGRTYQALYNHADSALYVSKRNGRNQFTLYSDKMAEITTVPKEIVQNELIESKTFQNHVSEYIFRILYEASDKEVAINSVLELIGKHYQISRAYIFEDTEDSKHAKNTFEWCAQGTSSQMAKLQWVAYKDLGDYKSGFNELGILLVPKIDHDPIFMTGLLAPPDLRNTLQFAIMHHGNFTGFIGFDQCQSNPMVTKKDISDLHNIASILSVFITEMRTIQNGDRIKNMVLSIINNLASFAYVCDPITYELLFVNTKTTQAIPEAKVGALCYNVLWNETQPCKKCPINELVKNGTPTYTVELMGSNMAKYISATASWIDWPKNSQKVCLIDSMDISAYKGS